MSLARWVNRRLVHTDGNGKHWPPGGGRGARWTQPDETEVAIVCDGDAIDLYVGRQKVYNVTLTPNTARRLAWWILRWWLWTCWFGAKQRLWTWSQRRILDEQQKERRAVKAPENLDGPPWR